MSEKIQVTVNGTVYTVEIESMAANGTPMQVRVNGRPYTVTVGGPVVAREEKASETPAPPKRTQAEPAPAAEAGA
ncbi:MAG: hypothetical protein K6V36_04345, partial [Anaerolineae bacterium]|nr:hypothetical protein [Anaerolineae bacterium]